MDLPFGLGLYITFRTTQASTATSGRSSSDLVSKLAPTRARRDDNISPSHPPGQGSCPAAVPPPPPPGSAAATAHHHPGSSWPRYPGSPVASRRSCGYLAPCTSAATPHCTKRGVLPPEMGRQASTPEAQALDRRDGHAATNVCSGRQIS